MGNQVEQGFFSPFLQRARLGAAKPYLSGRVLDIGCGNGQLAAWVEPKLYVGVDRDEEALAAARAEFPHHLFTDTMPKAGSFDTIVALALIEHLQQPQAELEAWSRLLAKGGKILLTTPHKSFHLMHELGSRVGLFSRDAAEEHEEMFDRRSLDGLAEQAGLRVVHYTRFLGGANQLAIFGWAQMDTATQYVNVPGNLYNKYDTANPLARLLMSGFLGAFDRLAASTGASRAYEAGCGEGHLSCRLLARGFDVRGSDLESVAVDQANERACSLGYDNRFVARSIYELTPSEASAELVICCEVLEHLPDPDQALRVLATLAKPYLLVSVPREPLWRLANIARGAYLGALGNTPGHIQHWTSSGFRQLLQRHVNIVEVRQPLPWTMVLCRV